MDTLDNNITSQDHMRIGATDKNNLLEMARWAKFLSIVGFVMLGFMALALISLIGLGASNPLMRQAEAPVGLMVLMFILAIALYFFPIYYLFKASKGIKDGFANHDESALSEGFRNLKSHYKFLGIFMIVVLSFYALAIVIGLGAGLSAL